MEKEKVKEILKKVEKVWKQRYPNHQKKLNIRLKQLEQVLTMSPHDDGYMRVSLAGENKVHLVPFEEMILNGLKGTDLHKYPIEEKKENVIYP